jgi:alpha-tubulin suppressor-like RCC1 family protein
MNQVNAAVAANTWPLPSWEIWSWGANSSGQLGLNNTTDYSSPKQLPSTKSWKEIQGGRTFTIAINNNNTLWSWGTSSTYGSLGLSNLTAYSSPVQVGALTTWSIAASGEWFTLALKTDGTLWSWGRNTYGQLGDGSTVNKSSPVQVGALTAWYTVSTGQNSSYATKTDGTLWSWGQNQYGQLGLNNTTTYYSPKQVGALTTWQSVCGGITQAFAIKTNGTLWAWGNNNFYGQLGLGDSGAYTNRSSPTQVGLLTTWASVISFSERTVAIKTDGTLWSWGNNAQGQLGLGNTTDYSSPKQVGALTNWSSGAGAPLSFSFTALKTNGTIWSWGYNASGQLGLGDTVNRSSPTQIGTTTTWLKVTAAYANPFVRK